MFILAGIGQAGLRAGNSHPQPLPACKKATSVLGRVQRSCVCVTDTLQHMILLPSIHRVVPAQTHIWLDREICF